MNKKSARRQELMDDLRIERKENPKVAIAVLTSALGGLARHYPDLHVELVDLLARDHKKEHEILTIDEVAKDMISVTTTRKGGAIHAERIYVAKRTLTANASRL